MNRRDALQAFAAVAATPLLGAASFNHLLELGQTVRQTMSTAPTPLGTLTPAQARSLRVLAEIIIPATDTPGASGAGVTEFIDTLLTDWMEDEERDAFLVGMNDLEHRAQASFGTSFVQCSSSQQVEITASMDDEVAELLAADRAADYDPYDADERPEPSAPKHFFYQLKRWTLVGYFTSEVGMTEELRHNFLPGEWDPCRVLEESQ